MHVHSCNIQRFPIQILAKHKYLSESESNIDCNIINYQQNIDGVTAKIINLNDKLYYCTTCKRPTTKTKSTCLLSIKNS